MTISTIRNRLVPIRRNKLKNADIRWYVYEFFFVIKPYFQLCFVLTFLISTLKVETPSSPQTRLHFMTWCRAHKSQDPAHTVNPQRHFWGPIWILNKKNHGYRSEIGFISLLIQLLISLLILSLRDRIRIILAPGSESPSIFFGSDLNLEQNKI